MSTDLSPTDDSDLDTDVPTIGDNSILKTFILFLVLCAVFTTAFFFWIRPAMNRTDDAVAETRSAQEKLRGEMESSKRQADSMDAAQKLFENETRKRHEKAERERKIVSDHVKKLEDLLIDAKTAISQSSSDLGARMAAEVFRKADLIPIKNRAEALSEELDSLREDLDAWTKMREELLDGDLGKAIAANEKLVGRFASIELPTVTDLDIQTWTDVLPLLVKQMQDALERDAPSLIPLDECTKRVDDLAQKVREASASIRKARLAVAAIEQKAQPTRVKADTPTLPQALKEHEVRVADEFAAKRAEERQKKLDALAKQLADEDVKDKTLDVKIEAEKKQADRKTKQDMHELDMKQKEEKKQADLAAQKEKHKTDLKADEEKRKRAELEARFQVALPEIKSYLQPYIVLSPLELEFSVV